MQNPFYIEGIKFNDKTEVDLNYNDIVIFVGANNSGKSVSLKEIFNMLMYNTQPLKIINNISIFKNESNGNIIDQIKNISILENNTYIGYNFNVYEYDTNQRLDNFNYGLQDFATVYATFIDTESRLTLSNPAKSINFNKEPYSHPIHFLYRDDELEKEFSTYFNKAFNTDLLVNRFAGSVISLHIGNTPVLKDGEDRISKSYVDQISELDLLNEQGDGMRSFVGVLLNSFVSSKNMIFVDEPEAFLHPPQARLLGKMLSYNLPSYKQLFITTHSEDFLQGLLESNTNRIKIIRIDRIDNSNRISLLKNDDVQEIWRDPLLRHSNILSGLFHKKVVICESDSDCRFYSAILTSITDNEKIPSPDILFIHCGGKQRIPVVVKALKKLNVPTRVIADFDVLNNISPLKEVFENLGGIWNDVESKWSIVKQKIEEKRPELLTIDVKNEIDKILDATDERIFPKSQSLKIQNILKKASPWSEAKNNGVSYIPNGDATRFYKEINDKFEEKGLYIVEVGELENFDKSTGNHGPKWVNEVLQKDLYNDLSLEPARLFVKKIIQ
ncbi:ATP-dependent nuclease [Chryseobacterium cheonjiense]|uniref:ATP-binding protein n=1 Tax=Chryseobacterium cheonjiense TaxID=2728845 RepID=A0A7Y0A5R0_9FLAO|nr:AAA family ATPase [Chryseobacterium cheonjiense]NML57046.1 ATP-binding protein [Chryseobacterium cheonjiense]